VSVYTVPALNAVDFALTVHTVPDISPYETGLTVYTVPALNAVDFALTAYTPPTFPYVGWELLPGGDVAPIITGQPQSTSIQTGGTAVLTVTATGANLTYQWYVGPSGDVSVPLVGETAASVSVSPLVDTTYWVRVTSGTESTDSNGALVSIQDVPPDVPASSAGGGGRPRFWSNFGAEERIEQDLERIRKEAKEKTDEAFSKKAFSRDEVVTEVSVIPDFGLDRAAVELEARRNAEIRQLMELAILRDDEEALILILAELT